MEQFLEVCERAARLSGQLLLQMRGTATVREKASRDLVTAADLAAQEVIFSEIRTAFPTHLVIGEEQLHDLPDDHDDRFVWYIDPLDGTTNFVHGLPYYSTSIGLVKDGQPIVGAIFNPETEECFTAAKGQGAYLNGSVLRVSNVRAMSEALMGASFAATVDPEAPEVQRFLNILGQAQALRRMGSAALNLCYVAASRLDGYFGSTTKAWDVAAGIIIVREAGGLVTGIDGGEFNIDDPHFIAAATSSLHGQVMANM